GVSRGSAISYIERHGYFTAEVLAVRVADDGSYSEVRVEAMMRETVRALEEMLVFLPSASGSLLASAKGIKSPGMLADFVASNALVRYQDKQEILECSDAMKRLELLCVIIEKEIKLIRMEDMIHRKVKSQIDENQREYYLREQLKVIQGELGIDSGDDVADFMERIEKAKLPLHVEKKLMKEVSRLVKTPFGSPEATVSRGYIETCLEIPWGKYTEDTVNLDFAEQVLNDDHEGLEKIKERILEYLAVKQMSPELKNQIICFVGPPGVGKTSLGKSIAKAMGRRYSRISLGGVRDESDIRGHRKTYIGSMPGRIINALIDAGTMNPVLQLDEIDKLSHDLHGDPASALLEVLDGEQNREFRDHFVEIPVDLSDCVFLASANTLDTIPSPLIDRMEIIELSTYTPREKLAIAKNHLIPKQLARHGLKKSMLKISDDAIRELIAGYTRESGVRNLEREIASLCRKAAKFMIDNKQGSVSISKERLKAFLGARKFNDDEMYSSDTVGVVNGLAYTSVGGDVLKIEVSVMEGVGKLELTGTLGDVMKESARIAISYVRAHSAELGIPADFYKTRDLHIHVPEGAVPKDGPSAGVTMVSAIASALSEKAARCDVAMTGEVTLTGRVLPIGGLKEKTCAAYTQGIKRVIIPVGNVPDLEKIDPEVRENLEFIPCSHVAEVLENVLVSKKQDKSTGSARPRKTARVSSGDRVRISTTEA
ncbi:MAG: endopeptidase La, partial [Clostridia bacterium]|nr:endopeptidase La [Clostridia bacterium]